MVRKIIQIDEEKCDGCGLCAEACHEGAIGIIDGKAKLLREDYCDGLGNCLPVCPTGAIAFEEREAPAFDEKAVMASKSAAENHGIPQGCPGSRMHTIGRNPNVIQAPMGGAVPSPVQSELRQWPIQIQLVPINAPYFNNANLLVSADCASYARASFHNDFMRNKITLIGCPKLDEVDYIEKLTDIIAQNNIKSVTVIRMEVPCCGGIENAVKTALQNSGKMIPWQVVTLSISGEILED